MNKAQISRQNMHLAVVKLLNNHSELLESEPLVLEAVNVFLPIVEKITQTQQYRQNNTTNGYTANKNKALDEVFTLAANICLKVRPYARKLGDAVLLKAVDYSYSDLKEIPDAKGLTICKALIVALQPHLTGLQPYKVTQTRLNELETAITNAIPKTAERDIIDAESINSTQQLTQLFKAARNTLIDLDDLVKGQLMDNHPSFVATYLITRRITESKGGNKPLNNPDTKS